MTKEQIDEMVERFVADMMMAALHDPNHGNAIEQGEIFRKGMYRTYGIKEEAPRCA